MKGIMRPKMKTKFLDRFDKDRVDKVYKISGIFILSLMLLIFIMIVVKADMFNTWFRKTSDGSLVTKLDRQTTVAQRYEIISDDGRKADIFLSLILAFDGYNRTVDVGHFNFDYAKSTIYLDPRSPALNTVTVIYTLPEKWFLNQTTDRVSYIIIDKRKQTVRGDPIFFKGIDYPEDLLVDKIEIHVDAIKIYEYDNRNETAYNFVFSASEDHEEFDIIDFRIFGNNLIKGVDPRA